MKLTDFLETICFFDMNYSVLYFHMIISFLLALHIINKYFFFLLYSASDCAVMYLYSES